MATDVAPITIYNAGEIVLASPSRRGSLNYSPTVVVTCDAVVLGEVRALRNEVRELKVYLQALTADITVPSIALTHSEETDHRSDEELLVMIKNFFEQAVDDTIYPSDVAGFVKVPYERVLTLLERLERDGKIVGA